MTVLTLKEAHELQKAQEAYEATLPIPPALRHTMKEATASMFGLYWYDDGWDSTMYLVRMYEGRKMIFSVDDWYAIQKYEREAGRLTSAPSNCPDIRYLLVNGRREKI